MVLVISLALGQQAPTPAGAPSQADLDAAVAAGIQFVQSQTDAQIHGARTLQAAIEAGNLTEARLVYGQTRRWYEQIELLAYGFPDLDSDLDARPYGFPEGETSDEDPLTAVSGSTYLGIHKIEALIFRDNNISAAVPYAQRYISDSQELPVQLRNSSNFNAKGQFAALIAEATEVSGKKVSSEEETFSDLSNLIFFNNFLGLQGVYQPFGKLLERRNPLLAQRVNDAISAALDSVSGYVPFQNGEATVVPYSFVTVPARAPIQTAGYELASVLTEAAGALGISLEAEEEEEDECTPTVNAASIPASSPQIQNGLNYFKGLLVVQQEHAANLSSAIRAQDLDAAKLAYLRLRPYYEQIEVLAASFPDIDSDIDAREYAFPYGERDPAFKGNHHLEALIFRDADLGPSAQFYADGLQDSFNQLDAIFADSATDDEVFNPTNNFGGIIALATEIIAKKISSEEEKYSDRSYLIFYNNYKGIYSQAAPFYDEATSELKAELEDAIQAAVGCLQIETDDQILNVDVADNSAQFAENLAAADYKLYSQADISQKKCLTYNGYRVQEVLLETAAALNLFDDCSDYYTPGTGASASVPDSEVATASADGAEGA